jgi:hypothetical protein
VAIVAATLAWIAAISLAAPATAGEWMEASCQNPDGSAVPVSGPGAGWTGSANNTGYGSFASPNCGPGSPMVAELSSQAPASVGASEALTYTAPAGSTLAGGRVNVALSADGSGYNASGVAAAYAPAYAYDATDVFFQCAYGLGACGPNGLNDFTGTLAIPAASGGTLTVGASCNGVGGQQCNTVVDPCAGSADPNCQHANTSVWALAQVNWADLLLANASAPGVSGTITGTLLGTSASPAHGTATLEYTATDPGGPGVYLEVVQIDGHTVYSGVPDTNVGACHIVGTDQTTGAFIFDSQQPCKTSETVDLGIDTTHLSDGPHQLKLISEDAAQNVSTLLDLPITVDNYTTASSTGTESPISASGTTGTTGTVTPGSGAAGASTPPQYSFRLDKGTLRLTSRPIRRSYPHSSLVLSGQVNNPAGTAQPNAPVTVTATSLSGGTARVIANAVSDGAGLFTIRVPRGDSRLLRLAAGHGVIAMHELVTPTLRLHTRALGGGRLRFSGRVSIAQTPSSRPLLIVEILGAYGWQYLGQAFRPTRTGAFSYTYQASANAAQAIYTFRVVTPKTPLWQAAASATRRAAL